MITLEKLFDNFFDNKLITDARIVTFCYDTIARMTANNPGGIYDQLIADLQTLADLLQAKISSEGSAEATQQGKTISKDVALSNFVKYVQKNGPMVKAKFIDNPEIYEEFFPHGLSEFNGLTVENAKTVMDRMVEKATSYQVDANGQYVQDLTDLRTAFVNARTAQVTAKGVLSDKRDEEHTERSDVNLQLSKTVLTVAMNNIGHKEKAAVYFNESLLFFHGQSPDKKHGTLPPSGSANVFDDLTDLTVSVKLINDGTTDIAFWDTDSPEQPQSNPLILHPGDEATRHLSELTPGNGKYLRVANLSSSGQAKWKVELLEP